MTTVRSLTFLWVPWSAAVSVLIVVSTAALCFVAWRRSGYRRDFGLLEVLRLALVCLVALLFNQPEWVEEYRPEEKPSIAVLWDDSASMETRDVSKSEAASTTLITRRESIARLTDSAFWHSLQERLTVVIQPFATADTTLQAGTTATTGPGKGSNLHEPLATAPQRFKNLRAVVLASDGDWNEGPAPVLAASALRLKDIPVFTVPVGSSS
ncbi:MAG: VWA domain-containing protein, partial [Candidatus Saccharimonas sp.]|nr:VWA domain-containing protein [Planctomycetaceae bacterium]